jgi:hypothetical protein
MIENVSDRSPLHEWLGVDGIDNMLSVGRIDNGHRASIKHIEGMPYSARLNKKRSREFRRLQRKLSELGEVTFERVCESFDVILRFEEFLLLETRSWKGRRGTSIHTLKKDAAFARQSVVDLAREGNCEIFSLRLDDSAIASIILFKAGASYYPWKITFNEEYSRFSPGTLLMVNMTEELTYRTGFSYGDSLAKYGNSWMSHLWPDTTEFSTLILGKDADSVEGIASRIRMSSAGKSFLKRLLRVGQA